MTAARRNGGVIALSRIGKTYTRVCALSECGKTFTYTKHNKKKQYCDRKCAGVARQRGGVVAQKVETTTLQHHGVKRFFADRTRFRAMMCARYGVENASNIPGLRKESWKKAHETKKQNGTYKASKIERSVYDALVAEGCDVVAQKVVLGKPIDITIKEKEETIYLQVDGCYWHGLDRPIELLKASITPRDISIVQRWENDRHQDEQFAEHGLKLVWITDHEAQEWLRNKQVMISLIRRRANEVKTTLTS